MKVAWVCEYPAWSFRDRPRLKNAPPSHPVPWIVVQAPRLVAAGVELHIVSVSKHIDADDEFERGGIHFHFLKIPRIPRAAMAYQLDRVRITRCLRRINPAVVHGFGTESSFGYSAVSSPFPSVLMIQGIVAKIAQARGLSAGLGRPGLSMALWCERVTVRRARHVVCETAFAADFVRELNPTAVTHIVRTPILEDWFGLVRKPGSASEPEVLFVGWVVPAKGVDLLIAAFARVACEFPRAMLHVVGAAEPGYLNNTLLPEVKRLGLSERVVFHGSQPQAVVGERLSSASVLVLPTLMDTAPNVLAEARAAGVPVVASAVGGIPELVEDGVDGVLVAAGSVDALTKAITALLRDPHGAEAIAERGRARVGRDHRLSIQVPKLLDVYREAVSMPVVPA